MRPIAAVVALWAAVALAGTRDPDTPDQRYLDLGSRFATYTARISGRNATGGRHAASAVLLAPRWVVTAAHVVRGCTGLQVALESESREVDLVVLHPDADDKPGEGEVDLALCRLAAPVELPWYPVIGEVVGPGDRLQVAGYGWTGPMDAGYDLHDGRLRAGWTQVELLEHGAAVCLAARGPMRLMIAPGDSGGPAFTGSGPAARLVAINSFQTVEASRAPLKSRIGERSGHCLLGPHRAWIERTMHDPHPDAATLAVE